MLTPGSIRRGEAAALAALAFLLLALNLTPITNNDLFLHLKTGEMILKTGSVPRVDDYSALARGRPFIAHEWLAGVLFRLVQVVAGWNGLILLKPLAAIAVAALLYATARLLGAPPVVALPALAFVMILAAARFMERPHIFTYLIVAISLLLLALRRIGRRRRRSTIRAASRVHPGPPRSGRSRGCRTAGPLARDPGTRGEIARPAVGRPAGRLARQSLRLQAPPISVRADHELLHGRNL